MGFQFDKEYCISAFKTLLGADSTTGQYEEVQRVLCGLLDEIGVPYRLTRKGGVIADAGGEGNALAVTAHLDDIGLMVRHVNADGTLNVCPVGGLHAFYAVMENVRVYALNGKVYTGTANSHGYERTHIDGLENTFKLLMQYITG
ncbi:MAG: hypothetical protein IJR51_09510 [Clostridia bacterium]|nr:hypothetical protein [Clostridia bacterium]